MQLQHIARRFVDEHANAMAAYDAQKVKDDWRARSILFSRDALLFCEFESAVSYADAGRVLEVFKYWGLGFRGTGQHNYARECWEIMVKWKYELTASHRDALEAAWFVNRSGKPGRFIAADLYLEQLNFWVKVRFNAFVSV